FRLLANAGIRRVCFGEFYRDPRIFEIATKLGVELVDLSGGQAAAQVTAGAGTKTHDTGR
ncbi:MAG: hypothetical protein M3O46_09575, partial [Myxococcota bacterium]|nr:hypothetical protein [Myxococcota bacterium]